MGGWGGEKGEKMEKNEAVETYPLMFSMSAFGRPQSLAWSWNERPLAERAEMIRTSLLAISYAP